MSSSYDNIERPYGELLERASENLLPENTESGSVFGASGTQEDTAGTITPTSSGASGDGVVIKNSEQFSDLWIQNTIKSLNWKPKKAGFYIDGATGYAEFANIFLAGGIEATEGLIGGWTIEENQLSSGNVKIQSLEERILMGAATDPLIGNGIFMGKDGADYKFRAGDPLGAHMLWSGSNLLLTGASVTALGINSDLATLSWSFNAIFSKTTNTVAWTTGTILFSNGVSFTINPGGSTPAIADNTKRYIYFDRDVSTTALQTSLNQADAVGPNKLLIAVGDKLPGVDATYQVFGGGGGIGINAEAVPTSANAWVFDGAFISSSNEVVAWGAGTLSLGDNAATTFSISAGNTGVMTTTTYIYFNTSSPTILQTTTTASVAVGLNKILVAVARNVADATKNATFQVFGGAGGTSPLIAANQMVANTITANELATTLLYAGSITLDIAGNIKGGQTAYDTGTGFFLGYSGGQYKLSMGIGGQDDQNLRWDGTKLIVNGYEQTGLGTYGGDGSDGSLTVTAGTTTLNAGQLYQFTTLTIEAGGTLAFTGEGIAQILVQNNFELQAGGVIELRWITTKYLGGVVGIHALESGNTYLIRSTDSLGGGSIFGGSAGDGGSGGDGIGAGAGTGGAAGSNSGATDGVAGVDGTTGVTGGGGGGGGGATVAGGTAPTAGAAASGMNGGNGGNGGWGGANSIGGAGGSGGGGTGTGNGGAGGEGGEGNGNGGGGNGGVGGDSGPLGGNGGAGGHGGYPNSPLGSYNGGDGGRGGSGYINGGRGGNGRDADGGTSYNGNGGYGGNGGDAYKGTGGDGGDGGAGSDQGSGRSGGSGGDGYIGGDGGEGGGCNSSTGSASAGSGGDGGDAFSGAIPLFIFAGGNMIVSGTVNAHGGRGGDGGQGGSHAGSNSSGGNAGDGGNGGDGADVYLLCKGTFTKTGIINTSGGRGGDSGNSGVAVSSGKVKLGNPGSPGAPGRSGRAITGSIII